jgi:hypothetical protein
MAPRARATTRALAAAVAVALAVATCAPRAAYACTLDIGEPTVAFPPFSGTPSPVAYDAVRVFLGEGLGGGVRGFNRWRRGACV